MRQGKVPRRMLDDAGIRALLESGPRIAIVGASANPARPVFGVMQGLLLAGYDVVPVNPTVDEVQGCAATRPSSTPCATQDRSGS